MATAGHNLSAYNSQDIPNCADFKIGIVVSEWNDEITSKLLEGAKTTLLENGVKESNIHIHTVPGAFELPLGCQFMLDSLFLDGVIAIGCVIQGETKHFDFVCNGATNGIMQLNLSHKKPISFCLLTDNTKQQSIDRSGGKHGNKGTECAVACLKMIGLKNELSI